MVRESGMRWETEKGSADSATERVEEVVLEVLSCARPAVGGPCLWETSCRWYGRSGLLVFLARSRLTFGPVRDVGRVAALALGVALAVAPDADTGDDTGSGKVAGEAWGRP